MLSCQSFAVSQSIVPNSALCRNGHCGLSLQDTETRPGDKRVKKKKKKNSFLFASRNVWIIVYVKWLNACLCGILFVQ